MNEIDQCYMEGNFYSGRVGSLWDRVVDVVFCLVVFPLFHSEESLSHHRMVWVEGDLTDHLVLIPLGRSRLLKASFWRW